MIKSLFIFIAFLAVSSSAQGKTFPVSPNDNQVILNILGSGNVLMSVNMVTAKLDNTYSSDRNTLKIREGINLLATDANIPLNAKAVTGVKVLMSSSGLVKLYLTLSTGKELVISASEIIQRRTLLASNN
jgi:hypothetical protein